MAQSDTAIARLLVEKRGLTEPQFEIWHRAVVMGHSLREIAKDYPVSWVTVFAWRNRATSLIEEVQDAARLIEEERANQPKEIDPLRFDITVASGSDVWEVHNPTEQKIIQRVQVLQKT